MKEVLDARQTCIYMGAKPRRSRRNFRRKLFGMLLLILGIPLMGFMSMYVPFSSLVFNVVFLVAAWLSVMWGAMCLFGR